MASQALYRRYRSQTFDELIGQEHIVQTLRNALAEGRVAHAYLFTGPRGVGKTTVARLLAKAVNCTAEQSLRPCGECESCVAIAEGHAVDVIEMDAASHTSVEDARELIERVQFRPTLARYKVYTIDECHMLSTAAFNALLKTLEEPPGHALFILATTEIHKVPATILSRCQRFTFSRHSISSTAAHLREIAAAEGFSLDAGAPEAIARAATGSMRDALSILDQLMAYGGGTINLEQVRGLLGATESQEVVALVEALVGGDLTGALRVVAAVAEQGADLRQFARDLVERLRALMLLKAGGDPDLLDMSADDMAVLERQCVAVDLGTLLAWVKLFSSLDYQLRTSAYGQLPLEMAMVEALATPTADRRPPTGDRRPVTAEQQTVPASPSAARRAPTATPTIDQEAVSAPPRAARRAPSTATPTTGGGRRAADDQPPSVVTPHAEHPPSSIAAPAAAVSNAEQDTPSVEQPTADDEQPTADDEQPATDSASPAHPLTRSPAQEAAPETSAGIASANADVAALEQVEIAWPDVLQGVRARDKTLFALLNSGVRPIDVEERMIVLEVKSDWLQKRLEQPNLRRTVESILSKQMGSDFGIRCVVEAQHRENPNALREQIRKSRKDQHVKAAINIFDAEIIAVEADQQGD
jgi:DNA polymerase III subunit gamma/tau